MLLMDQNALLNEYMLDTRLGVSGESKKHIVSRGRKTYLVERFLIQV